MSLNKSGLNENLRAYPKNQSEKASVEFFAENYGYIVNVLRNGLIDEGLPMHIADTLTLDFGRQFASEFLSSDTGFYKVETAGSSDASNE